MADKNNTMERKDVKKQLMASSKNEYIIGIICKHELFNDLLNGNPQSILLLAQCFKMTNQDPEKKDKNNLLDLYMQLKEKIKKESAGKTLEEAVQSQDFEL